MQQDAPVEPKASNIVDPKASNIVDPKASDKQVLCLVGPTAVGKTACGLELAERLSAEIVSADSRQVYRRMDIGTDKPSPEERRRVPHHLIDRVEPDEVYTAGRYRDDAREAIRGILARGRLPLVVGGTGLYLRALFDGIEAGPPADSAVRARLLSLAEREGPGRLHRRLSAMDPVAARKIHPNDCSKLVRALEVLELTGCPLSEFHRVHRFRDRPFRVRWFGLIRPRSELYQRIEERVDRLIRRGLVEEVRGLIRSGFGPDLPSMRGLGYRQIAAHLAGMPLAEAIALLKRDTRRYAKRQLTWFRRQAPVEWLAVEQENPAVPAEKIIARWKTGAESIPAYEPVPQPLKGA